MGYHRAGFEVSGVDIVPQRNYPFLFMQGNALLFQRWNDYDAVHASPPCQMHSDLASLAGNEHEDLIQPVRELLISTGKPYVIENVEGAPLLDPIMLCGSMFELGVEDFTLRRHRLFESNVPLLAPGPCRCAGVPIGGVYGDGGGWVQRGRGGEGSTARGGVKLAVGPARVAMGIDWTNRRELSQAIPPAYAEHLGVQLIAHLEGRPLT
jgi:DNA (cytosine-5)-methyltransferase 1